MNSLLDIAIKAALAGGEEIMKVYELGSKHFNIEIKSDNSPLTIADKNANSAICAIIEGCNIPILSEEIKALPYSERCKWSRMWIVDPLDGTKEFIKRNGEFTVNIALVEDGIPTLGVVYIPAKKRLYFGNSEIGSYLVDNIDCNSTKPLEQLIECSNKLPLNSGDRAYTIVASRSHLSPETAEFIDREREIHNNIEITSIGSSIKICLVCEGSADVYPRFAPTMEWDTAAGDAVARSMGLMCAQVDEKTPLQYNKENLLNPWFIIRK